jgi:Ca2+-binding RTX toxin-like protein
MRKFGILISAIAISVAALPAGSVAASFTPGTVIGVENCEGKAPTIFGTDGNDKIIGTDGNDVIVARGGSDQVWGVGGNDIICGGSGWDSMNGGDGDDRIIGGSGLDHAWGANGNDRLDMRDGVASETAAGDTGYDACITDASDNEFSCEPAIP